MDRQYKQKYQKPSQFFEDGKGARKPLAGTVPIGFKFPHAGNEGELSSDLDYSAGEDYLNTGLFGDFYGQGFPETLKIDEDFLARGKERYQITCTPCHGESGNGQGIVSKYWAIPPTANLIDERVSAMPEGQIFWTITHGKGLMGPYNGVLSVRDRWAIVAYVQALQAASK
jgi:mono/diheme cytochrome c family protein